MAIKTYKNPGVTVDVVIFTIGSNDIKVLLIKRENAPFKDTWALPGGFLREEELTKEAAFRILKSKAGVGNVYMEQLYTFDKKERDPRGRVISVAYFALIPTEAIKFENPSAQSPLFWSLKTLPKTAFDHKDIIAYALKRLRSKLEYTNVIYSLLPRYFTLSHLQEAYEAILGKKMDKRNFRKKFELLRLIRPTRRVFYGARQRPAKLYEFVSRKPAELKKFF
ncbi:MAG: hypothetical protein A3B99_04460 [Candidatus Yanofskybacteria bacterium RIFCSPHIGHO2_02_FULL_44_12b]|uniref:Nudix hydrolase domain-containing protein n=2 Tax=Candidatus Yanofskyibacteriota TaxID=1752733 RepID=A0A1F8GK52_9BACT|nr:MAG: NUDIX hydrolase [Candidatus Yanofskybacteria bacterium GW2011_GWA2_44_9]OGN04455.1 MAG: hypothetical protein A2659_03075 [Candidatus Yanofskybacteria bacterium RIFCSPHIGHO2_01_FULL_44_24]OGN14432.1 MAG: hypothetical protein A3B99_04460 [Candidatus Yanofskybacteria bacterium RIFCSPHIGHO2_02_FULL_44_12b]OGN25713.1 MAG: hypothetical protein A2925_00805 [Candidatus Yanofskybacteria bacterium RIFCSPLOWO2_01_FULL_44_22]